MMTQGCPYRPMGLRRPYSSTVNSSTSEYTSVRILYLQFLFCLLLLADKRGSGFSEVR